MKYTFSALVIIFALISCEKDDIAITEPQSAVKQDILSFATQEDFDNTLAKVSTMTKAERNAWEKEQGFKSFGTICDEFYESINPEQFGSLDEVKAFVAKNSDKIELNTNTNDEIFCEPLEFNNGNKYLINSSKMVIIGSKVYKYIDSYLISSSIANVEKMKSFRNLVEVSNNSEYVIINNKGLMKVASAIENTAYKENTIKIGSDNYLIKLYLRTNSYYDVADPRNLHSGPNFSYAFRKTEYRLINYSRRMFIWWVTSYNSSITGSLTTTDSYNVSSTDNNININGPCDDSEYRLLCLNTPTFIYPNDNSTSYFVNYNITAKNIAKNLTVTLVK